MPVPEFLFEQAARLGDKPGPGRRPDRGFGKGDVLALSSPNLPEYAVAMYGTMAAGASSPAPARC